MTGRSSVSFHSVPQRSAVLPPAPSGTHTVWTETRKPGSLVPPEVLLGRRVHPGPVLRHRGEEVPEGGTQERLWTPFLLPCDDRFPPPSPCVGGSGLPRLYSRSFVPGSPVLVCSSVDRDSPDRSVVASTGGGVGWGRRVCQVRRRRGRKDGLPRSRTVKNLSMYGP